MSGMVDSLPPDDNNDYIHPVIAEAYASGELARIVKEVRRGKIKCEEELSEIETAVLVLLP